VVAKNDLAVRVRAIPNKSVMDIVALDGNVQTIAVTQDLQDVASLSDTQVAALARLGKKIETQFTHSQDIEWCRVGDTILLLQTRPLKTRGKTTDHR
jgi:pyruvate,water dikinase